MTLIVRVIVIMVLLLHGLGHSLGFLAVWSSVPVGFSDRPSDIFAQMPIQSRIGKVWSLFWLAAMIGFLASGIGLLLGQTWWFNVAIVSAVISLVAVIPWWRSAPPSSETGAILVDAAILWIAIIPGWQEQLLSFLSAV